LNESHDGVRRLLHRASHRRGKVSACLELSRFDSDHHQAAGQPAQGARQLDDGLESHCVRPSGAGPFRQGTVIHLADSDCSDRCTAGQGVHDDHDVGSEELVEELHRLAEVRYVHVGQVKLIDDSRNLETDPVVAPLSVPDADDHGVTSLSWRHVRSRVRSRKWVAQEMHGS
jgi:hypothetical protein